MRGSDKKYFLSPSLMCMGFLRIEEDISILNQYFDAFHIDISDGHFCKNLTLSPEYIKDLKKISKLPLEAHLMVDSPNEYIERLAEVGTNTIIIHVESVLRDAFRTLNRIHSYGLNAGIALCPETPIEQIIQFLPYIDIVTVMNVDIGFIGQPIIPEMIKKTTILSRLKDQQQFRFIIQSDGGVGQGTYNLLAQAGTESFILGKNALFSKSPKLNISCQIALEEFYNEIYGGKNDSRW